MGRSTAIIEVLLFLGLVVLGVAFAVVFPLVASAPRPWAVVSVFAYVAGLVLFLAAKLSVFRTGTLLRWGSAAMTTGFRICYRASYAMMLFAIVIAVCLIALPHMP